MFVKSMCGYTIQHTFSNNNNNNNNNNKKIIIIQLCLPSNRVWFPDFNTNPIVRRLIVYSVLLEFKRRYITTSDTTNPTALKELFLYFVKRITPRNYSDKYVT